MLRSSSDNARSRKISIRSSLTSVTPAKPKPEREQDQRGVVKITLTLDGCYRFAPSTLFGCVLPTPPAAVAGPQSVLMPQDARCNMVKVRVAAFQIRVHFL